LTIYVPQPDLPAAATSGEGKPRLESELTTHHVSKIVVAGVIITNSTPKPITINLNATRPIVCQPNLLAIHTHIIVATVFPPVIDAIPDPLLASVAAGIVKTMIFSVREFARRGNCATCKAKSFADNIGGLFAANRNIGGASSVFKIHTPRSRCAILQLSAVAPHGEILIMTTVTLAPHAVSTLTHAAFVAETSHLIQPNRSVSCLVVVVRDTIGISELAADHQ